jgi:hypothetical protein
MGKCGDMDGVCIAPVTAQEIMTLLFTDIIHSILFLCQNAKYACDLNTITTL